MTRKEKICQLLVQEAGFNNDDATELASKIDSIKTDRRKKKRKKEQPCRQLLNKYSSQPNIVPQPPQPETKKVPIFWLVIYFGWLVWLIILWTKALQQN